MSRSLRRQIVLSIFLSVTVAALALHKSAKRTSAPAESQKIAHQSGVGHATPPALASAEAPVQPKYSDLSSAADRRRLIVDRLRALGVPNDVLALVALEDFEVEWDGRFEACGGDSAKLERVQLEKDMSKDAAMRAALGAEGFKQWDTKMMLWEAMSTPVNVTPREAESIYALKKNLQQRQFDLEEARINGTMDRAQVIAAVQQSYADYNQQLKAVLGDGRYAKSQQLDDAFVAGNLRYELASVNPSEMQFQDLFQADKQWNEALTELNPADPNYLEHFKAANDARDQEYARVLGPQAFHDLREHEDTSYIQMKKYENLWGLDEGKINNVYDTMNAYRKAVGDYQVQVRALQSQGQDVDWAAVNSNLQKLTAQTQQSLQSLVGAESFSRLQRNGILRWAGAGFRPTYGTAPSH